MNAFVVMGVSGCGKTSVARALAMRTGGRYLDADDFHPAANRAKMASGIALTDEDRSGWLDTLGDVLAAEPQGAPLFLACSALREAYRDRLRHARPDLGFIYLRGSRELIADRLGKRTDHFMPAALLESQFAALEEPTDALTVEIDQPLEALVETILCKAGLLHFK